MEANQPQTHYKAAMKYDDIYHITNATSRLRNESKYDDNGSTTPSVVTPRIFPEITPSNDAVPPNKGSLILLDWDDTLFPTTVIVEILKNRDENGFSLVSDETITLLSKLGQCTLALLTQLISKYGSRNMFIVTNSLQGWIAESLQFAQCISVVYREIEALLSNYNISMQSAQTMFKRNTIVSSQTTETDPVLWKQLCITQILSENDSNRHVISIGDQWADHHSVRNSIKESVQKTAPIHHMIKLKMCPGLQDMVNEVLYVDTCFVQIFDLISCKNSTYSANLERIQPIIIDYHREELKYEEQFSKNGTECECECE